MAKPIATWVKEAVSPDEAMRRAAEKKFVRLGSDHKELVPALVECLRSDVGHLRYCAARALSNVGPDAAAVIPLATMLDNDDHDGRFWALMALAKIGADAYPVLPQIVACMKDAEFGVRQVAVNALARIAPDAPEVVPALVACFAIEDEVFVREDIVRALGKIGSQPAIDALVTALDDGNGSVRGAAVIQLKCLAPVSARARPALEALLAREKDQNACNQIAVALRVMSA